MKILIVAYDYPPLSSPQAIRWHYLSRELARQGASVHVLAPSLPAFDGGDIAIPDGVVMHRSDAGGLAGWVARRRKAPPTTPVGNVAAGGSAATNALNWKGRVYRLLDRLISVYCYPDSRGQWYGPALRELRRLVGELRPDVLICSHEPAVCLRLGLAAADSMPIWMADLGDPVLAPYTPTRWRRKAMALERQVCQQATAVSVTTERTRRLLIERHRIDPARIWVLTQGFDERPDTVAPAATEPRGDECLHLFYAGRFYPFRSPEALLRAVSAVDGVRLTIAAPEVPSEYLAMASRSGGRIVFVGSKPHAEVLRMQQECDVLVNIGNALQAQIPGKLYEYLGSGKPILHLSSSVDDPVVDALADWGWGWSCANESVAIGTMLTRMRDNGESMWAQLSRDTTKVREFAWSRLGAQLLRRCTQALHPPV